MIKLPTIYSNGRFSILINCIFIPEKLSRVKGCDSPIKGDMESLVAKD